MIKYIIIAIFVVVLNLILLSLALFLSSLTGIDPSSFYGDPNAVARQPFAIGFLSNTGAIAWISAASITLFSWWMMRSLSRANMDAHSLLMFGLLTAWLGLDDLFMLHDGLVDHLGISQLTFVSLEALMAIAWGAATLLSPSRFGSALPLLILAATGLGCSIVIDQAIDADLLAFRHAPLLEDVAKLTGIMFWTAYAVSLSRVRLLRALEREGSTGIPGPIRAPATQTLAARRTGELR